MSHPAIIRPWNVTGDPGIGIREYIRRPLPIGRLAHAAGLDTKGDRSSYHRDHDVDQGFRPGAQVVFRSVATPGNSCTRSTKTMAKNPVERPVRHVIVRA